MTICCAWCTGLVNSPGGADFVRVPALSRPFRVRQCSSVRGKSRQISTVSLLFLYPVTSAYSLLHRPWQTERITFTRRNSPNKPKDTMVSCQNDKKVSFIFVSGTMTAVVCNEEIPTVGGG